MTTTAVAPTAEPEETAPDTRLIREITLRNLLSFGPDTEPLALGPLNVLIGPNGSGKSNLIDGIDLLRSTAGDMSRTVMRGGGITEWIWKGNPEQAFSLNAVVSPVISGMPLIRHTLQVAEEEGQLEFVYERIDDPDSEDGRVAYDWKNGRPITFTLPEDGQRSRLQYVKTDASILSQRRDPAGFFEITYLAESYEKIRIYRDWSFGRRTVFRTPQPADMRNHRLEEDFSNLGLLLNRLRRTSAKAVILERLRDFYDGLRDFDVSVEGGTVQVFLTEGSSDGEDWIIPATRLSDGTLRYLCLLAILCDPNPPPLICLEEPELGLHPDLLPAVTDLLVDASTRTQLIVTTHSRLIVDCLETMPEAVVVCEKHDRKTQMQRLNADELKSWLEKYSLGELWSRGDLGGNRW